MSRIKIVAVIAGVEPFEHEIETALGHRWWRRSMLGFGYQDERVLSLGHIGETGQLLIVHEQDMWVDAVSPFSLFPILEQDEAEAEAFFDRFVAGAVREPKLL